MSQVLIGFETPKGKVLEVILQESLLHKGWEGIDNKVWLCRAEKGLVIVSTSQGQLLDIDKVELIEKLEEYETNAKAIKAVLNNFVGSK